MNIPRKWKTMKNSKGFTLLELIIVVAMVGIMAAIAIPSVISRAPDTKLKSAARDIYSTLQKARSSAVKINGDARVFFDVANNAYDFCDDWNSVTAVCDGNLQTSGLTALGYGIGYGHGNAIQGVPGGAFPAGNVSFSGNDFVFDNRGLGEVPSGYVYLDHNKNSTTYAIGALSSGSIRILKWNGSAWE